MAPDHRTEIPADSTDFLARLRAWFDAVADLPAAEREAWIALNVADSGDRHALQRLLASDAESSSFFEVPVAERAAGIELDDDDTPRDAGVVGTRVGAFRLVRLLGRGGMAAVFLGEREEGDFQQQVAVKLLRRGLYSELEQRLFQRERRVLAALSHANIAHLIDGGLTEAGVPYLVMEYVDGKPITQYANERALGVRERVALLLTVCRAVSVAHRNLVVHRDIKPSNILVSADGTVKLLDFGIAKLLEDDVEAPTAAVFTPEYAAPEQIAGRAVTTATDVHALGVLLHEVLLGKRPGAAPDRRPSSLVWPATAAAAAAPGPLRRALRGDLDNILLRALQAEPERRYASAGALADDLQRYLEGRAVEAHPPSRLYRTRKFVARHKGAVSGTLALLVAIFAALGVALWQASVARREALRAEAESRHATEQATRAEHVKQFLLDLFGGLDPDVAPERRPTLAQVFERGVAALRGEPAIDPRLRTELLTIAGDVLFRSGERQRGLDVAGEAVALGEAALPADSEEYLKAVAMLSDLDFMDSRVDIAGQRLRAALDRAGAGASPARVSLLLELGLVARRQGDLHAAARYLEQAHAMRARAGLPHDERLGMKVETELAYAYFLASRIGDAARLQRPLLERARVRHGAQNDVTMRVMGDYAETLARSGRYGEALDLLMESGTFFRRTQPAPNEVFASWLYSIGMVHAERGLWRPALRAYSEAAATHVARYGGDDIQTLGAQGAVARVQARLGEAAGARATLERLLAIQLRAQGPDHPRSLVLRQFLGDALLQLGDAAAAADLGAQTLAAVERSHGSDSIRILSALALATRAQMALGHTRDAVATATRGVRIAESSLPIGDLKRIRALLLSSRAHADDRAAAAAAARRALDEAAAAPERPLALEAEGHELLAASSSDDTVAARERERAAQAKAELARAEQSAASELDRWLAEGPAYR